MDEMCPSSGVDEEWDQLGKMVEEWFIWLVEFRNSQYQRALSRTCLVINYSTALRLLPATERFEQQLTLNRILSAAIFLIDRP